MSDKKNIERLFQEKFKDFEVAPPPRVWDNIEVALQKKKKRRVIPIWFRLSGVAALLLVGTLIGYGILNYSPENVPSNSVVNQENKELQNDNGKNFVPTKNPVKNNEVVTETNELNNANSDKTNAVSTENNAENNAVTNQEASEKLNSRENNTTNLKPKNTLINSKNNAVANQENQKSSEKNKNKTDLQNNSRNNSIANSEENNFGSQNKNAISNTAVNRNNNAIAQSQNSKNSSERNKDKTDLQYNSKNNSIANSVGNKSENQSKNAISNTSENRNNNAIANQENRKSNENKSQNLSLENKNNGIADNKNVIEKRINKTEIAFDTKALEEQNKDSTAVATVVPNALEELLLQQEKEKQAVTETKVNRWQITPNVAPIYFSSASNGSPISSEFSDNSKNYDKNLSYGLGINYAFSNKWTVRSGVNKLTLGYSTNDIVYYAGLSDGNGTARSSVNGYHSKGSQIIVEDNSAVNTLSFDNVPGKTPGQLNQTMGYIEVPVELSYKLLDRKFGIDIIGGMSTMFLNENNLSVASNGFSVNAGKADNLNDISFTSNIGLGFKYKFWKSFQANVEPKFKYQINTFSQDNGGFKPYFIGIYSGLSFSF